MLMSKASEWCLAGLAAAGSCLAAGIAARRCPPPPPQFR